MIASHLSKRLETTSPVISSGGFTAWSGACSTDYSKSLSLSSRGYFFHVAAVIGRLINTSRYRIDTKTRLSILI